LTRGWSTGQVFAGFFSPKSSDEVGDGDEHERLGIDIFVGGKWRRFDSGRAGRLGALRIDAARLEEVGGVGYWYWGTNRCKQRRHRWLRNSRGKELHLPAIDI
jgi:hypothetical protein